MCTHNKGSFGTKIKNAGISNVRISNTWISSAGIIFSKCLVHCFPPHLVFGLKIYRKLLSNWTLELLCNWVQVNNCRAISFYYDLETSYVKNNFDVIFAYFSPKLIEDK